MEYRHIRVEPLSRHVGAEILGVDLATALPDATFVEIRRALSTRAQNRPASALSLLDAVRAAASDGGAEPEPAETARLRSGAHANAPTASEPGRALRGTTGQQAPLALAPTEATPRTEKRARRRKGEGASGRYHLL